MKQQIVVTDAGKRLDKLISEQLPELTRSAVQHLMQDGCVTIAGKPVKKNTKASAGDVITVELPEPREVEIEPEIPIEMFMFGLYWRRRISWLPRKEDAPCARWRNAMCCCFLPRP